MPEYYRLSEKDLKALDKWWDYFTDRGEPDFDDLSMREFIDKQKESIASGKGKR